MGFTTVAALTPRKEMWSCQQIPGAASTGHVLAGSRKGDKLTPGGIESGGFLISIEPCIMLHRYGKESCNVICSKLSLSIVATYTYMQGEAPFHVFLYPVVLSVQKNYSILGSRWIN